VLHTDSDGSWFSSDEHDYYRDAGFLFEKKISFSASDGSSSDTDTLYSYKMDSNGYTIETEAKSETTNSDGTSLHSDDIDRADGSYSYTWGPGGGLDQTLLWDPATQTRTEINTQIDGSHIEAIHTPNHETVNYYDADGSWNTTADKIFASDGSSISEAVNDKNGSYATGSLNETTWDYSGTTALKDGSWVAVQGNTSTGEMTTDSYSYVGGEVGWVTTHGSTWFSTGGQSGTTLSYENNVCHAQFPEADGTTADFVIHIPASMISGNELLYG